MFSDPGGIRDKARAEGYKRAFVEWLGIVANDQKVLKILERPLFYRFTERRKLTGFERVLAKEAIENLPFLKSPITLFTGIVLFANTAVAYLLSKFEEATRPLGVEPLFEKILLAIPFVCVAAATWIVATAALYRVEGSAKVAQSIVYTIVQKLEKKDIKLFTDLPQKAQS